MIINRFLSYYTGSQTAFTTFHMKSRFLNLFEICSSVVKTNYGALKEDAKNFSL